MSTNYYLHKEPYGPRHIGKTYFRFDGTERGLAFIWAIDPAIFDQLDLRHDPDVVEVRNEYGDTMSLRAFRTAVLEKVKVHETQYIGKEFS